VIRSTGPSTCSWKATSDSSWLTITDGASGGDRGVISYKVDANLSSSPRNGKIRITWDGGSNVLDVGQSARQFFVDVLLFDFKESISPTTVCQIKNVGGGATTCTFRVDSRLNEAPKTVDWSAVYDYYGVTKTPSGSIATTQFTISEQCNANAPAGGDTRDLTVTVTVTDTAGNTQKVIVPFVMRVFPCS
jgi:hypothetical protein